MRAVSDRVQRASHILSIVVASAVVVVVVWSYVAARAHGAWPEHHPWKHLAVIGNAFGLLLVPSKTRGIVYLKTSLQIALLFVVWLGFFPEAFPFAFS